MYWLKIDSAKTESRKLINDSSCDLDGTKEFVLSSSEYNELTWSERNKEFVENDLRYDIVSIQYLPDDQVKMECYPDGKETDMVDALSGFIEKMFSSQPQSPNDSNNDISGKIYKEYLPVERLVPFLFPRVLNSIKADCVLVNAFALIAAIWHPPCA